MNVDPLFVAPGTGDFHLAAGTPVAISEGAVHRVFILNDRDGTTRTSPQSIGAFERD
ncbi:hypothetical protein D3C83_140420 [compost metagenome]